MAATTMVPFSAWMDSTINRHIPGTAAMNLIYRLVWNRALKTVQVASELASPRGSNVRTCNNRIPALLALAAAISLGLAALPVQAAVCPPPGGTGTYICGENGSAGGNGSYTAPGQGGLGSKPGDNNGGNGGKADSTGHNNQGHPGQGPGASGAGGNYLTHGMGSGGIGGKGYLNGLRKFANGGGGGGGGGVGASFSGTGNHNGAIIMGGSGGQGGIGAGIGHGGAGGGGGSAIWLDQGSYLVNEGTGYLHGGDGADGTTVQTSKTGAGDGGQGASGIDFHLTNNGIIHGGNGGIGAYGNPDYPSGVLLGENGGSGGAGIGGSGFALNNSNTISGGAGGNSGFSRAGGTGGAGVVGERMILDNQDLIHGGAGGSGGAGGTVFYSHGGDGSHGGIGGAGIRINGAADSTLENEGTISGGQGGVGGDGGPYRYNTGATGGSGGTGVYNNSSAATLLNSGKVSGGAGGSGGDENSYITASGRGGEGGLGIYTKVDGLVFTNEGSIKGGDGGTGGANNTGYSNAGDGGTGGAAISGHGFQLTNDPGSSIVGGAGGAAGGAGGHAGTGGIGIISTSGSTIITGGAIIGGLSGDGETHAQAINFSGGGNTLTLENGFSFQGDVVSTGSDTLVLGGDSTADGGTGNGKFDVSYIAPNPQDSTGAYSYSGFSQYAKTGTSTWTLTGTTLAVTPWTIDAGTLSISSDKNLGATSGALTFDGGTLENTAAMSSGREVTLHSGGGTFQTDANLTLSGTIGGKGGLTKTGTGTLILTAVNTYTGGTTIAAGTLQIGDGSGAGSITGNIVDNGALAFDGDIAVTFAGGISGAGTLTQGIGDTLILTGNSSAFTGTTTLQSNILVIGNTAAEDAVLGGDVTVGYGGILSGHGTIGGNVTVEYGGNVGPGSSGANLIGTLIVGGDLTAQGNVFRFDFGKPATAPNNFTRFGQGDSIDVGGNLTLDGSTFALIDTGGMGPGLYNLFTWGGTLTENHGGFTLGATPAGTKFLIQTLTAQKQINLIDTTGVTLDVWNANDKADVTRMGGGNGIWSNTTKVWTDATGAVPNQAMQPQPGFALFGGDKGVVTVDDSADPVQATGMQFAVGGYTLTGDTLTLVKDANGNTPVIRVGNGSAASTGMSATISNVLTGTAGFIKTDLGTLVLTAANTYTGGTTVNGGTLEIAAGGTPGGGTVTVDGHAVLGGTGQNVILQVDNGAAVANHIVLNRGALLDNAGTITGNTGDSSAIESASGTATVRNHDGGTIAGAATGVALSTGGEVDNDAMSTIRGNTAVSIAGGSGTLRNAGTMTGNVTLDSGYANTVELTAGGTIRGNLSIGSNAASTLTLDGDDTTAQSYSEAVTGTTTFSGTLTKAGSGVWILDNNALSGVTATTIQAGALIVGDDDSPDALLGGTVNVAKGATLGGFGTVGGIDLAGILATGHSVGTLHTTGDVTFRKGSIWQIEANPNGTSDALDVDGKAIIQGGSALVLVADGHWQPRTAYTILTAKGDISGQFDKIGSSLTFLVPDFTYGAHRLTLTLQRNNIDFDAVARTPNQKAVAVATDSLGFGNPVYGAIVTMNADQARNAFDLLSGEWYASALTARLHDSRYVREAMDQRLSRSATGRADASAAPIAGTAGTVWFHAWGHWGKQDGDGNAARTNLNGSGLLVGVDAEVGEDARIGGVLGSSQSSIRTPERVSDGHGDATWVGIYGSAATGPVHWRGGLAYARERIDSNRHLAIPGLTGTAGTSTHGSTGQVWAEGALPFATAHGQVAPFLNLAYVRVRTEGWTEGGNVAALQGQGSDAHASLATLGVRGAWNLGSANHPIQLHGRIGWRQAFGADTPQVTMRIDGSTPFTVYGLPLAQHAVMAQAGVNFALSDRTRLDIGYSGQFASDLRDQGARMTLKVAF